jgi:hypothetical protein
MFARRFASNEFRADPKKAGEVVPKLRARSNRRCR